MRSLIEVDGRDSLANDLDPSVSQNDEPLADAEPCDGAQRSPHLPCKRAESADVHVNLRSYASTWKATEVIAVASEARPPELHRQLVRWRLPCQTSAVTGQRHSWGVGDRVARNPRSRPWLGPSHGYVDQAWRQAGGPAVEQPRGRRVDLFRVLDAVHRRRPSWRSIGRASRPTDRTPLHCRW